MLSASLNKTFPSFLVVAATVVAVDVFVVIKIFIIFVPDAPRNTQTSPSNSVVVTEGDTTVIACTSDAFPPATFTWSKDGNRIASTANLTVAGATPGDSGQIRCTATNEKGSDSVDFNVVVRCKRFIDNGVSGFSI